jgi:ATP/maltotriose-dependent transcriptional regulator MalT
MLTTREIDVLGLLAQGCSYAAIGERLGISAHTVASHIKNAYRKLGVHCAAAAVMRAVELQLLGPRAGSASNTLNFEYAAD